MSDRFDRDVSEDAAVGAYIALIDGERLEAARTLARAVRAIGFRTPLWALADSHRISDLAVVGGLGEVEGYIYLGQQTPTFYAKQVVASVVKYGMSLLPPFFGGLMAYDGEANDRLRLPGPPGRPVLPQVAGRPALLQALRREHLPQRPVQRRRRSRRPADPRRRRRGGAAPRRAGVRRRPTYFVLNGTSTSNKVVTNAVLRRGDLVLFDRNNHKSLHQGALVQAGAIPIFLPTARNPFGMIGAVDWEAWDEKYLREQIRAQPAGEGQAAAQGRAPVPAGVHPARDLRRHGLQRAQGAREDRPPVRLRAVGRGLDRLQRLPSAVRRPQPDAAARSSAPEMPGLFSTQSVHKQGAGFSQASQIHKRDEHIRGQQRYVEHKRFNESFLMNASTSPFYPLFASLDVNAKIHEGKAGEMLWDRCIELGIETRKKLREFGRYYARTGAERPGEVVLRSVRARRRDDPRLEVHRGRHRRPLGGPAHRGDQARAAVLELPSEEPPGTATPATPTATRWSTPTS